MWKTGADSVGIADVAVRSRVSIVARLARRSQLLFASGCWLARHDPAGCGLWAFGDRIVVDVEKRVICRDIEDTTETERGCEHTHNATTKK